jgi:hypothetical protein
MCFKTEQTPPHSSQFTAEQTYPPHTHSADWNAALEAFLCSCGDAFPLRDGLMHDEFSGNPFTVSSPPLSAIPSPSECNSISSTFSPPMQPIVFPAPLYASPSTPSVVPAKHPCLWNGCRSSFSSLAELISHVNLLHLSAYSSEPPEPVSAPSSYLRLSSDSLGLSCQWGNCHEYSSTALSSSGTLAFDDALNLLTGHLLHDHLGLQDSPEGRNLSVTDAAIADAIVPVPEPKSGHDMEMLDESENLRSPKQSIPSGESAEQSNSNKWHRTNEGSPITEDKMPSPVMGGREKCQWRGCELSFMTVDDLMNHLTAEHVGSGKNHYECFWKDCGRSGKNGFTSKQKVCRHLQVRSHGGIHFDSV